MTGKESRPLVITYATVAIVAMVLLIGYLFLVRKKEPWFLLLYACVTVVNAGYFLLSIAKSLEFAIFANDLSYLGSVFLTVSMLLTIIRLCGFEIKKKLVVALLAIGAVMFAIIATSGFLPLYYKEVSLVFVGGAAKLQKVYGPLHPLYLIYLFSYFAAMVACILQSMRKGIIASQKYAVLLVAIVFGNLAIWFVEKFIPWDFEFLSVSYLFSEIILLGLYRMMQDYVRVDLIRQAEETAPRPIPVDLSAIPIEERISKVLSFVLPDKTLSQREQEILELLLMNRKRKEIAAALCLSENTIKTYTRTLYGKLGVSSREEFFELLTK